MGFAEVKAGLNAYLQNIRAPDPRVVRLPRAEVLRDKLRSRRLPQRWSQLPSRWTRSSACLLSTSPSPPHS